MLLAQLWRKFEPDLAAVDRGIEREQQAAIAAGQPWPPPTPPYTRSTPLTPGSRGTAQGII